MPPLRSVMLSLMSMGAAADGAEPEGYRTPPPVLVKLATAPQPPRAIPSPDGDWALLVELPSLLPIADVAQPELKLGGLRFNPENHDQSREPYATSLTLARLSRPESRAVSGLPAGAHTRDWLWSPDGQRIAFAMATPSAVELWVLERASGVARRVTELALHTAHPERAFFWLPDSRSLVCRIVPGALGPAPVAARVPIGPFVDENAGKKSPAPTFEDLLKSEHDAALFAHHLLAEVWRIGLDGTRARLVKDDLTVRAEPSPDGRYLLVETLHRPFSYMVPQERFPRRFEIRDRDGALVKLLADLPLADQVPIDRSAVRTGRRHLMWRADADATVAWVEAQDGGEPRTPAKVRDKLFMLAAPFTSAPTELASLSLRFEAVHFGDDQLAIVVERWFKDRKLREWRVAPGEPAKPPQLLSERSYQDRYADPGKPVMRTTARGRHVIRVDGTTMFRIGEGASPEGSRPFFDAIDLTTLTTTRRWHSQAPFYEEPLALLPDGHKLLTRREAVDEPPHWVVRDLTSGALLPLTQMAHPCPELKGLHKELIHYKRKDGVALSGTLYLPPHEHGQQRLPVLLWAYPQEVKSVDVAGQVRDSPYRFPHLVGESPLVWLARGFAVLENPSFPIVGEGEHEPNDRYVEQLVADAQAAIDELVRRGVGDRERVAIGGHSYGAFTTANLLAHSRLFRAGIARSGAYNRTLTPFGFQQEERSFWEAPTTYIEMSPFTHAAKIEDPLLLIHGMEDANQGTHPLQSERLFAALKGLGKTVRLVMLPHESHHYRARESVLHMLWESDRWLERYVKKAAPRPAAKAAPSSGAGATAAD
jgi:dipeptidyl aminopeptidase/acylaminoacyl peptidase